jgi:renal tumor antigen
MHEKEIRFTIKSQKTQINTSTKHTVSPRKHHQNGRSPLRLTQRYPYPQLGKLALVFELMDMNLYECLKNKKNPLTFQKIKFYMFQVLRAIDFMHRKGIFHRDIKPENILVKGNVVKLADLGSCKGRHSPAPYTDYISTRWYRAPECLMTDGYYN